MANPELWKHLSLRMRTATPFFGMAMLVASLILVLVMVFILAVEGNANFFEVESYRS
jgi:hypothetical protein